MKKTGMEPMQTLEGILAEHPCCRGLAAPDLQLISGCAQNLRFAPGEYLFREGDEAEWLYLVHQGRLVLEVFAPGQTPLVIQTVGPHDLLGWSWFCPPYHWHYDVRAVEHTHVIALSAACLRHQCEAAPRFGYELLKRLGEIMVGQLQATRLQLLDVYGYPTAV